MADVLIRGMEMPIDCHSCWMRVYCFERGIGTWGCGKGKPCPILPLPEKHGRLIDAEASSDTLMKCAVNPEEGVAKWFYLFAAKILENCPTIIEAEGGGEDG